MYESNQHKISQAGQHSTNSSINWGCNNFVDTRNPVLPDSLQPRLNPPSLDETEFVTIVCVNLLFGNQIT